MSTIGLAVAVALLSGSATAAILVLWVIGAGTRKSGWQTGAGPLEEDNVADHSEAG